jgi:hypothetical protein
MSLEGSWVPQGGLVIPGMPDRTTAVSMSDEWTRAGSQGMGDEGLRIDIGLEQNARNFNRLEQTE